ncbi:MAG: carboxylating nicotinate-nucleotide diphosphorylase [Sphingobacteriales bacterium]|uniref:carboxylating nicotinate-nucleotide diphosphorylase n=1 Tax=Hydrotalea flava TaxID=714549 RepID=UPI00082FF2EE|nr:carboxylating nicotinate-nucleotide diphosphorylase [Hydrotalea flava]RTL50549.1 MAG: carboxylating nicotinate-nucleotide diphosphorylase [Sphingobacteriales bacterium]
MINFEEKLNHLIIEALKEDIGDGDHTTLSCIAKDAKGKAVLKIKEAGILAGVAVAQKIFHFVEPEAEFEIFKEDGAAMLPGDKAFEVTASVHTILSCERLVLNCMQRMSGIATLTHAFAEKIKHYRTQLLDTRKTTPNFRLLEKEAVRIGGGTNHRFGLFDMLMLKDNHIDYAGGIENAIHRSWQYVQQHHLNLKIEIEARNITDVTTICKVGKGKIFRILLDNFTPAQITEALQIIQQQFETEASGGIHLENIESYAATGVDYISAGGLIHQAKSVDLSLKAMLL